MDECRVSCNMASSHEILVVRRYYNANPTRINSLKSVNPGNITWHPEDAMVLCKLSGTNEFS